MASNWGARARIAPTVEGAYGHAWQVMASRFWLLIGLFVATMLLAVPYYVVSTAGNLMPERFAALGVVLTLGAAGYNLLVLVPAQCGLLRAFARAARGESASLDDVIAPFRSLEMYLSALASMVLLGLIYAAILSPVLVLACLTGVGAAMTSAAAGNGSDEQAAAAALAAVGLGMLAALFLCAIPMIWVSSRLLFTQVLVSDEGRGPIEAIRRSWAMTRGHALTIILVMLLSIPIALAGLLAFCVGVIPATTWILLAIASMYVALGGGPQQQGSAPPAPLQPPLPPQG